MLYPPTCRNPHSVSVSVSCPMSVSVLHTTLLSLSLSHSHNLSSKGTHCTTYHCRRQEIRYNIGCVGGMVYLPLSLKFLCTLTQILARIESDWINRPTERVSSVKLKLEDRSTMVGRFENPTYSVWMAG